NEIRNNPNVTLSEIAEKIGVSRRWIATNMKHLQDTGVVKRVGPNKGGYWKIIDK
ncbi:MAG: HTH domain-containing protein, partial [Paludibacteraceae bacterium]|nr:HTH domain-containing protein [Paludibacteraceae bacterium]